MQGDAYYPFQLVYLLFILQGAMVFDELACISVCMHWVDITLWSAGMKESKKLATILGLAGDRLPYSDNVSDRDRSKSLHPFYHEKKPHRLKYLIDSKRKLIYFP